MSMLSGLVRLIRPINCIMMGLAVFVGAALAHLGGISASWLNLILGFVTGFALTGASMAINDYYDRKIDMVNEPKRPIPSGAVSSMEAIALAISLTVAGVIAAYFTNFYCLFTAIIAWIVFVAYTTVGKRAGFPGNLLVSTCVAIPFIYGSLTITDVVQLNVLIFASMAFLSNTGREITKGIVDVTGDQTQDVRTLAVRFGPRNAALTAVGFFLASVMLTPIPWLLELVSFWFIPLVAITDAGLILSSIMLLKDHSRENARRTKKIVLLLFAIGLLAFIVGSLK